MQLREIIKLYMTPAALTDAKIGRELVTKNNKSEER